jgi:hypothetical protein
MSSNKYVAIAGTWAQHDEEFDPWLDWWHPDSHWSNEMRSLGMEPLRPDPFVWSTDLDGTILQKIFQHRRYADWIAAAHALKFYTQGHEDFVLISHSHGGQVALLGCKLGVKAGALITISTPVRDDVLDETAFVAPKPWIHTYSGWDKMQWLGELFDGIFGIRRQMPGAINLKYDLGHSGLLTTELGLAYWPGILSWLY